MCAIIPVGEVPADEERFEGARGTGHAGHLPTFVTVTDGRMADITASRSLKLPKGSIVAADRAYMDLDWINSLILQGVDLVTRLKKRLKYRVLERRKADRRQGVTSDQTIEFTSARAASGARMGCGGSATTIGAERGAEAR